MSRQWKGRIEGDHGGWQSASEAPITVVYTQFDDLITLGLAAVIEQEADLQLVAANVRPHKLEEVLEEARPRVAIVDLAAVADLKQLSRLTSHHPGTAIMVLASSLSTAIATQLHSLGVAGALSTSTRAQDLVAAVRLVVSGLRVTPTHKQPAPPLVTAMLTQRERHVYELLRKGYTNAQIAVALTISIETVKTHVSTVLGKLGATSRRELIGPAYGGSEQSVLRLSYGSRAARRHPRARRVWRATRNPWQEPLPAPQRFPLALSRGA